MANIATSLFFLELVSPPKPFSFPVFIFGRSPLNKRKINKVDFAA